MKTTTLTLLPGAMADLQLIFLKCQCFIYKQNQNLTFEIIFHSHFDKIW